MLHYLLYCWSCIDLNTFSDLFHVQLHISDFLRLDFDHCPNLKRKPRFVISKLHKPYSKILRINRSLQMCQTRMIFWLLPVIIWLVCWITLGPPCRESSGRQIGITFSVKVNSCPSSRVMMARSVTKNFVGSFGCVK